MTASRYHHEKIMHASHQGWGAGAGCFWFLGAGAAQKKIAGAAWKKSQEPEPLINKFGEDKKHKEIVHLLLFFR